MLQLLTLLAFRENYFLQHPLICDGWFVFELLLAK